jgi:MFS family permease
VAVGPVALGPSGITDTGPLVLIVLLAASSLTVMSGATIAPSLPGLADHFSDVPDAGILARLALTLPALFIAVSAPLIGVLVDRVGPRAVLLTATIAYVAAGSSGLFVQDLYLLLAGRALLGLAVAGVMVATTTLIAALYPPSSRDRVLGYQGAAMSLGGVVFLTLGGALAEIGWRLPFAIYALPLILLPFIATRLPARRGATAADPGQAHPVPWLRLAPLYLAALAAMILFYVIPTQLPFRLAAAGFTDASLAGYAIAISTLASAAVSLSFRRIKAAVPSLGLLALMFGGLGLGLGLAGWFETFPMIALAMLIAGVGTGLTMPTLNSMVLALTPPDVHGRAAGGLSTSIFLGQFLSPIVMAAAVPGDSVAAIFVWAGGAAILGAVGLNVALVLASQRTSSVHALPVSGPIHASQNSPTASPGDAAPEGTKP